METFMKHTSQFNGARDSASATIKTENQNQHVCGNPEKKRTMKSVIFRGVVLGVAIGLTLWLCACATSPKGRRQLLIVPDSQMTTMGIQAFNEIKSREKIDRSPSRNSYVKCITTALTSSLSDRQTWEVVVFEDSTPNAFALPGGKIGVHTGMMNIARTQGQLAAVIAHEVGHVIAHHGNERVSEQFATQGGLSLISSILEAKGKNYDLLMAGLGLGAQFGILLPHSRTQESEADLIGLDLMAKAGFNPQEAIQLWQAMEKAGGGKQIEFLSTHPSHGTRIEELEANMANAQKFYEVSTQRPNCQL
jgi:predicted Zn-dependent protease